MLKTKKKKKKTRKCVFISRNKKKKKYVLKHVSKLDTFPEGSYIRSRDQQKTCFRHT